MSYFEKLHPWCIIRPLPNMQRRTVARFRRRNDAEAHLRLIDRLIPNVTHTIIFDPTPEQDDSDRQPERSVAEETETVLDFSGRGAPKLETEEVDAP